ncbi:MAG: hypothetical protein ABI889_08305 [Gemmatimonadota bacterium]
MALAFAFGRMASAQSKAPASAGETAAITALVHRFYGDSLLPDRNSILTVRFAKMLDTTPAPGAMLPRGTRLAIREIQRDSTHAIYETESGPEKRFADWYTYLVRESGKWKIDNVRIFELPPAHYLILDSLEAKKSLPDSIAFVRDRMHLSSSTNAALKANFAANKAAILNFASLFESHATLNALDESGATFPEKALPNSETKALTAQMHALKLGAALRKQSERQCVRYKIGGIEETTVGYMHFGASCTLPNIGTEDVMYMERVAPDWYVYRTG